MDVHSPDLHGSDRVVYKPTSPLSGVSDQTPPDSPSLDIPSPAFRPKSAPTYLPPTRNPTPPTVEWKEPPRPKKGKRPATPSKARLAKLNPIKAAPGRKTAPEVKPWKSMKKEDMYDQIMALKQEVTETAHQLKLSKTHARKLEYELKLGNKQYHDLLDTKTDVGKSVQLDKIRQESTLVGLLKERVRNLEKTIRVLETEHSKLKKSSRVVNTVETQRKVDTLSQENVRLQRVLAQNIEHHRLELERMAMDYKGVDMVRLTLEKEVRSLHMELLKTRDESVQLRQQQRERELEEKDNSMRSTETWELVSALREENDRLHRENEAMKDADHKQKQEEVENRKLLEVELEDTKAALHRALAVPPQPVMSPQASATSEMEKIELESLRKEANELRQTNRTLEERQKHLLGRQKVLDANARDFEVQMAGEKKLSEELRRQINDKESQIGQLQDKLLDAKSSDAEVLKKVLMMEERNNNITATIDSQKDKMASLEKQKASLEEELAAMKKNEVGHAETEAQLRRQLEDALTSLKRREESLNEAMNTDQHKIESMLDKLERTISNYGIDDFASHFKDDLPLAMQVMVILDAKKTMTKNVRQLEDEARAKLDGLTEKADDLRKSLDKAGYLPGSSKTATDEIHRRRLKDKSDYEEAVKELTEKTRIAEGETKRLQNVEFEKKELEWSLKSEKEQGQQLRETVSELQQKLGASEAEGRRLESEVVALKDRIKQLNSELEIFERQLQEAKKTPLMVESSSYDPEVEIALRKKNSQLENEVSGLKQQLSAVRTKLKLSEAADMMFKTTKVQKDKTIAMLRQEVQVHEKNLKQVRDELRVVKEQKSQEATGAGGEAANAQELVQLRAQLRVTETNLKKAYEDCDKKTNYIGRLEVDYHGAVAKEAAAREEINKLLKERAKATIPATAHPSNTAVPDEQDTKTELELDMEREARQMAQLKQDFAQGRKEMDHVSSTMNKQINQALGVETSEEDAAVAIQSAFRSHRARKQMEEELEKHIAAATIQLQMLSAQTAQIERLQAEQDMEEEIAASMIQHAWLQKVARELEEEDENEATKQQTDEDEIARRMEEEIAASKIQLSWLQAQNRHQTQTS